jgi:GNAT superfamily N-acetyltransferase
MDDEFKILRAEKPEWDVIGPAISEYNKEQAGDDNARRVCYVLLGPDQAIVGGLIGVVYWDWFSIDLMWVQEELRGRGYGHRLLALGEEEARQHGAKHVHLDTFSFQAPEFYKKQGYRVFGELQDFPAGHTRYYLTKELVTPAT